MVLQWPPAPTSAPCLPTWCFSPNAHFTIRISLFSFLIYLGIIDKYKLYILKYKTWSFNVCIHCEIIITIKLINISTTSYNYFLFVLLCVCVCVCVVRTLKIYSHSKYQAYNIVVKQWTSGWDLNPHAGTRSWPKPWWDLNPHGRDSNPAKTQIGTRTHAAGTQIRPKPRLGLEPTRPGLEPGQNP